MQEYPQEEHSKQWGIQSKTITKLFDIFINRGVAFENDKETTTILTLPSAKELLWEEKYSVKYLEKQV